MLRSASTFTVTVLIFTLFTILTSAAPTGVDCDDPGVNHMSSESGQGSPVPYTPSPVSKPTTSPTPAPPKVDNSTSSNDDSGVVNVNTLVTTGASYSGTATYFKPGLGACGGQNSDTDMIVALAQPNWDGGSHCGKTIQITNTGNQRVHSATIVDLCPGCASGCLDMSPSLFLALADDLGLGVFQESWYFT